MGLAAAMGLEPPRITEIIKGRRKIKSTEIGSLADYLEMTPQKALRLIDSEEFMGLSDPAMWTRVALDDVAPQLEEAAKHPPIPVWGSIQTGDNELIISAVPTDWIRRSERFQGVQNPFAFYFLGSSMSPAIEHGDLVIVNTAVPVRTGADCVFLQENFENTYKATVKRVTAILPDGWRVTQFDKQGENILLRETWIGAHPITEIRRSGF